MWEAFQPYFDDLLPILGAYAVGFGSAFSAVHSIKIWRRECPARRYPASLLRVLAFVAAFCFTLLAAVGLYGIDSTQALIHALVAGTTYPIVITIIMVWAKHNRPELYNKLRVRRRRATDNPNDTGTWWI